MSQDYIYVLAPDKSPLMPTRRYGHVLKLLQRGKARIAEHVPLTIQLKYNIPCITQPLFGGTDPGRTNIGNAVLDANGVVVYKDKVETRNRDIPRLMAERAGFRRASRRGERLARKRLAKKLGTTRKFLEGRMLPGCGEPIMLKDIINTEARFNNRKRPAGWITPTVRQLIQTHINMIRRIRKILPVDNWTLEINRFAFMLMEDGTVRGVDYYNDSKATNPDAAIQGIRAMSRPTILIGGGYDKKNTYDEWIEAFDGKVRELVLIGQTKEAIAECARRHGFTAITFWDTFEECLQHCSEIAREGEAVLLSPACASWGMFPNYEERGRQFKEFVKRIGAEGCGTSAD